MTELMDLAWGRENHLGLDWNHWRRMNVHDEPTSIVKLPESP